MKHLAFQAQKNEIEYEIYADVYYEWLKLMLHLGSTISLAFTDLITKADCFTANRVLYTEKLNLMKKTDKEYVLLMDFIKFEERIGTHRINGENHSKELERTWTTNKRTPIKKEWEPLFKDYQSTARNVQRGPWFFDFVVYILNQYVGEKHLSLS